MSKRQTEEVRRISGSSDWRSTLRSLGRHDFVHTYDYHLASKIAGVSEPLGYTTWVDGRITSFWPLLKRPIEGTNRFDLTSAYGYGGPLFAKGSDVGKSIDAMITAMRDDGGISLFSRMHPLFIADIPADSRGDALGNVIVIEVDPLSSSISRYRGSHRREINRLVESGFHVDVRKDLQALDSFRNVYEAQMLALSAKEQYFFSRSYYEALLRADDFDTEVFIAMLDGRAVAAALFVTTGDVMQYFLSGTDPAFRKLSPIKLVISHAHQIAIERGVRDIILGGGVGGQRDQLFRFKEGFSKVTRPFHIVKNILDPSTYDRLTRESGSADSASGFFPAYRA